MPADAGEDMGAGDDGVEGASLAAAVATAARERAATIACAESLTGGALCARLVDVPGVSDVLRGGVVSYQLAVKSAVLGVPADLLDDPGPVSAQVAAAMATGVRSVCDASLGLSTTGVAGPEPHGGHAPGTVWVGAAWGDDVRTRMVHVDGDRARVRAGAIDAALALALEILEEA
ncbi:CinA family protein [Demequina sp. NBRC 110051]|uniref:CinA family protein n=1 Tax=Demequina sp. NBRC 110051 TaxID=1570340 RepID=UPI001F206CD0|nr:CinA family protein [Demequina sp. NBRC 110051]